MKSDSFLFKNTDAGIEKSKEIIKKFNDDHEFFKLTLKVFDKGNNVVELLVMGEDASRSQVKNLIRGVGGKLQA